jgi:hypothetical protein
LALPTVHAAPQALKTVSGSLVPGDITSFPWQLNHDVSVVLFHYKITGGSEPDDVVYVSIDETGDNWPYLMGEGWDYCDYCSYSTGPYTITVEADAAAAGQMSFNIGLYDVAQPPLDFAGFIPANSATRVSRLGIAFPGPGPANYTFVVDASAGSYEMFVDQASQGVVNGNRSLTVELDQGFHLFEVDASAVGVDQNVRWTVQGGGEPIPEFPPFAGPLILVLIIALTTLAPRRSRRARATRQSARQPST